MSQEQYDLVFSGQLAPGFELGQVKKNIQALFRIDEAKVEVMFSGKSITLKKNLPLDVATKYRVAMKKVGARADLILSSNQSSEPKGETKTKPQTAPVKPAQTGSSAPLGGESNQRSGDLHTALGAQAVVADTVRVEISAPDFGIAAMGGDLLNPEEKRTYVEADVDTSQLSVAPQDGNLVDASELHHPEVVDVSIPDIDIAPLGSDVLKPDERKKVESVSVDISSLSVADLSENLSPKAPEPPPAPDVSHISLKD